MTEQNNPDPKRKEVFEWRTCVDLKEDGKECGKRFFISVAEKEYFEARRSLNGRAFALPKRCYPCRVARRSNSNNGSQHGHE